MARLGARGGAPRAEFVPFARAAFIELRPRSPHYHFRGNAVYRVDERMSVSHVRFFGQNAASVDPFLFPLVEGQPVDIDRRSGNSARNGLTARTVFFPFGGKCLRQRVVGLFLPGRSRLGAN